jgi:hypothetical protein
MILSKNWALGIGESSLMRKLPIPGPVGRSNVEVGERGYNRDIGHSIPKLAMLETFSRYSDSY